MRATYKYDGSTAVSRAMSPDIATNPVWVRRSFAGTRARQSILPNQLRVVLSEAVQACVPLLPPPKSTTGVTHC